MKQFPELLDWYARSKRANSPDGAESSNSSTLEDIVTTPVEDIENALSALEAVVAGDLLERLQQNQFEFFERVVLKLMIAMGYGASGTHFEHLGGPGDEGVDGVIHLDELGLEEVFVQAKRYADGHTVGPSEVRGLAGALIGKKAMKGVFVTTSKLSKDAIEFAQKLSPQRVILIDGQDIADLLIRFRVGVVAAKRFEVFEIDENFFVLE